jgi:hypothetical protein
MAHLLTITVANEAILADLFSWHPLVGGAFFAE